MTQPRKFLVIADGSDESRVAAMFAARRARHSGGAVTAMAVVEPADFEHWLGVGEAIRREAIEAAEAVLESLAEDIEAETGERPELLLREGETVECLRTIVDADEAIAILVLGADSSSDNPGPLVSALARGRGLFTTRNIPVTVVPGCLKREEIKALA
ncbi:MAG: universal stress protein [Pseudomonadota bacterium]